MKRLVLKLVKWLVLWRARNAPLNEMGELFLILAQRVYEHRKKNKGYVPIEIFESCLGMAGVSVSVQIVNEVVDEAGKRIGFALKKREANEAGEDYRGLYHNTCCTFRTFDTPEDALNRDAEETFGNVSEENLELLGITIHDEPERRSACVTVMHRRKVRPEDVNRFVGEWKIFSDEAIRNRNPNIVDSNWYQLDWVMAEGRKLFANVRGGYPA